MVDIKDETPVEEIADDQAGEDAQPEPEDTDTDTEGEDEEVTVSIGDDDDEEEQKPDTAAPPWVKDLREKHKKMRRENRELREKLHQFEAPAQQQQQVLDPGPRPKISDPGIEYDQDIFDQKIDEWIDKKQKAEAHQNKIKAEQEQQAGAWNQKVQAYEEKKKALKVKDFDDAEATVVETLNLTQRGIILQATDNPDVVVYALGKNPKRAAEFAAISDPVKFAVELGKLESKLKVKSRKKPPPPEKSVKTSGNLGGISDRNLDRLRAEAERTGDMSKVIEYKRKLRHKKAG